MDTFWKIKNWINKKGCTEGWQDSGKALASKLEDLTWIKTKKRDFTPENDSLTTTHENQSVKVCAFSLSKCKKKVFVCVSPKCVYILRHWLFLYGNNFENSLLAFWKGYVTASHLTTAWEQHQKPPLSTQWRFSNFTTVWEHSKTTTLTVNLVPND